MIKCFNFDNDFNEFSANTYVVGEKSKSCVIIDLGSTSKKIINFIKENFIEVKAILLTHAHFDHIRGINKFLEEFKDVPVYIDINDYELLKDSRLNCSLLANEPLLVRSNNIITFKNKDILNFDDLNVYQVYETPFHTEGSVCFLNAKLNALFSGDSLFKGSIGRYDLPTSNKNNIKSSLEIIKEFDENLIVYPGHGEITTIKEELKNNYYLQ